MTSYASIYICGTYVAMKAAKLAGGCAIRSPRDTDVWPCVCEHGWKAAYILKYKYVYVCT